MTEDEFDRFERALLEAGTAADVMNYLAHCDQDTLDRLAELKEFKQMVGRWRLQILAHESRN